jgi:hypothetical protein
MMKKNTKKTAKRTVKKTLQVSEKPAPRERYKVSIERWQIGRRNGLYLFGIVYGHPEFPNGARIETDTLLGKKDGKVLTEDCEYELGKEDMFTTYDAGTLLRHLKEIT